MTFGRTRKGVRRCGKRSKLTRFISTAFLSTLILSTASVPVLAAVEPSDPTPGTLLLPLTPKMDEGTSSLNPAFDTSPVQAGEAAKTLQDSEASPDGASPAPGDAPKTADDAEPEIKPAPDKITPEVGAIGAGKTPADPMADGPLLKGTVQIVADDTEYDEAANTFLGTGNAVAIIGGEDSKLEADSILYNQNDQIMDCRGNVRIYRNGQLTTGSAFRFQVTKDEYLITNPDTQIAGAQIVARQGVGARGGVTFINGSMQMSKPFSFMQNQSNGPLSYKDTIQDRMYHPQAFVPPSQDWAIKADKVVYERYLPENNLTVFGGRIVCGSFSCRIPTFVTTAGGQQNKVMFPVGINFSNNLMSGGLNVGPTFSRAVGQTGILTWSPMVQFGGSQTESTSLSTYSKLGLAGQVVYNNDKMIMHLGYGSASNLLVADFKERIRKGFRFQSGINRYLDDGMFGPRRARLDAELVDNHPVNNIPFIQSLNFRSAGGWVQDDASLLNQSSYYRALFGNVNTNSTTKPSAFVVQEHITVNSQPIFAVGDQHYGVKSYLYAGAAGRAYSSSQANTLFQAGPVLDAYLGRVRLQTGYTQSAYQGSDPFVYDKFIQGKHSVTAQGDYKINQLVTVGGAVAYNMDDKKYTGRMINAAIGPQDFKVLLSGDLVRGNYQIGFDVLYGQKVNFNKMVIKQRPDNGELGGI